MDADDDVNVENDDAANHYYSCCPLFDCFVICFHCGGRNQIYLFLVLYDARATMAIGFCGVVLVL